MAGSTNFFFNNFNNSQEQNLLESLIIEAISIYGEQMYFIPRNINNFDQLYTADDQSSYTQTYAVPIYIENINGFTGDGNFMSKFGFEIRDQVTFSIAQRVFSEEVGVYTKLIRPREGDLLYFPLNNKCFQIKFVDKFEMFYQLGKLYTWKMTCELFEYSDEIFNTGIPAIDSMQQNLSTNILDYSVMDEQGNWLTDEDDNYLVMEQYNLNTILPGTDNEYLANTSAGFIDFSEVDPFSEGTY